MRSTHTPSRKSGKNAVVACSDVLREEDARLLEHCTDIALTMDARASMLTVRARMTMGNGLPEQFRQEACPRRKISGLHGQHIHTVDRMIDLRRESAFDVTADLADHLVEALRQACRGDSATWEKVRRRVRVFCPDGAANEQLAGRLAGSAFTKMRFVIRCSAHAIQGCIKKAWASDARVEEITKIVQEVAMFLRSSSRFSLRFSSKACEDILPAFAADGRWLQASYLTPEFAVALKRVLMKSRRSTSTTSAPTA